MPRTGADPVPSYDFGGYRAASVSRSFGSSGLLFEFTAGGALVFNY
jgi:hypothetical protein